MLSIKDIFYVCLDEYTINLEMEQISMLGVPVTSECTNIGNDIYYSNKRQFYGKNIEIRVNKSTIFI